MLVLGGGELGRVTLLYAVDLAAKINLRSGGFERGVNCG